MTKTTAIDTELALDELVASLDWPMIRETMDDKGYAALPPILTQDECHDLRALYDDDRRFRSHIDMARFRFGEGEYKYFARPLPGAIQTLRMAFYPQLAAIANGWMERLGNATRYSADLSSFLEQCHAVGQTKPTPLLLRYEAGGYNCLHQDLYGEHVFPLQIAILLSEPGRDFTGGEFVMTEQRPRMQSRPMVVPLGKGDGVVFAVNHRPVQGKKSVYRVNLRHGVSRLHSGSRHTLGIIFHEAK